MIPMSLPTPLTAMTMAMTEPERQQEFAGEYETIKKAAIRNGVDPKSDDFAILLSIRKAESGGKGREFGILHPKAEAEMKKRPNETLDIQAGWAAATVRKNRARWKKAGSKGSYIKFLGGRYAPKGVKNDPDNLNANWIKNVTSLFNKIRQEAPKKQADKKTKRNKN